MAHKEMVYIKGLAKGLGYFNTLKAIAIATEMHKGQTRKSGEPYIDHPMRVTSALIALKIYDDIIWASAILHDTLEDCDAAEFYKAMEVNNIDPKIKTNVEILSKRKGQTPKAYYQGIQQNTACVLIKIADRCHNVSTMIGGFTVEKIKKYIIETEDYVLPLCHYGKNFYPEYSDQIFSMKYHIESVLKLAKAFVELVGQIVEEEKT